MKLYRSIVLIMSIIISGCAANPTQMPLPAQVVPTLTSITQQQPSLTATALIAAPDTPTAEIIQPTGTTEPTATVGMIMEIVSDGSQATLAPSRPCQRPANWVSYSVQRSDTLSSLAQRTGITWQQIQQANCMSSTTIFAGQPLYLPFVPAPAPAVTRVQEVDTLKAPSPGDPRTEVDPGSGIAGSTFVIKIRDFEPLATITIKIEPTGSSPISSFIVTMNADGDFDVAWVSPGNLSPGPYTVRSFRADGSQGKVGTILIISS